MQWLRDISIRNKLILMLVFTSVLVLGIFFAVFIATDIRAYKQRKADAMSSLAQVIGANSISTIRFQDNEAARNVLSELHNVAPEITHAVITYKDGRLFASYGKAGAGSFSIPAVLKENRFVYTDNRLYVHHDIADNNEIVGKIFLEVDLSELREITKSRYELVTMLLLLALVFSFLIAVVIQTYISKRLLYLVDVMKEVSKTGNYNKSIADNSKDEISTLIGVFNNLMQQVSENQRRKDEFISIASHELKTPMTSLQGYLQIMERMGQQNNDAVYNDFISKAKRQLLKLSALVQDLLDVSKIQEGKIQFSFTDFVVKDLIDDAIEATLNNYSTHRIEVRGNAGFTIMADRFRLEQVLCNLLSNAIKYSPDANRVIINVACVENVAEISVADFGIGIPKKNVQYIFNRFYRVEDISYKFTGLGIGLYICSEIIKRHNGSIGFTSKPGEGSTFSFSVPCSYI